MVTKNGLYPAEKYVDEYEKAESEECRKCKGGCGYIPMSGEYACIGFRPMTNAEWIRSLSDEALADYIQSLLDGCYNCPAGLMCVPTKHCRIQEWIKEEIE